MQEDPDPGEPVYNTSLTKMSPSEPCRIPTFLELEKQWPAYPAQRNEPLQFERHGLRAPSHHWGGQVAAVIDPGPTPIGASAVATRTGRLKANNRKHLQQQFDNPKQEVPSITQRCGAMRAVRIDSQALSFPDSVKELVQKWLVVMERRPGSRTG